MDAFDYTSELTENIKITTPEDIEFAEYIIKRRSRMDETALRREIREKKRAMTQEEIAIRSRRLGELFAQTQAYRDASGPGVSPSPPPASCQSSGG